MGGSEGCLWLLEDFLVPVCQVPCYLSSRRIRGSSPWLCKDASEDAAVGSEEEAERREGGAGMVGLALLGFEGFGAARVLSGQAAICSEYRHLVQIRVYLHMST